MSQNSYFCTQSEKSSQEQYPYQNEALRTPIKKLAPSTQVQDQEYTLQKQAMQKPQILNTTPRPQRKIVLYDEYNQKHFFPLYKDKDIGIGKEYQDLLIDSWNDDDKKTSSTQMRRGMDQTMQDLHEAFGDDSSQSSKGN
jgi:hypothetical protein